MVLARASVWRLACVGHREVNNEDCFSSRTPSALLAKGWMEKEGGGYVTTEAGRVALGLYKGKQKNDNAIPMYGICSSVRYFSWP